MPSVAGVTPFGQQLDYQQVAWEQPGKYQRDIDVQVVELVPPHLPVWTKGDGELV